MKIPILDLKRQYKTIEKQIMDRISKLSRESFAIPVYPELTEEEKTI